MSSIILLKNKWMYLCLFIFLQSFFTPQCFAEQSPEVRFGILSSEKASQINVILFLGVCFIFALFSLFVLYLPTPKLSIVCVNTLNVSLKSCLSMLWMSHKTGR